MKDLSTSRFFLSTCFLTLMLMGWQSCGDPRRGALSPETRTELTLFATRSMDTPKKYYKLTETLAKVLDEASSKRSNQEAMDVIQKFRADNDFALGLIATEFDGWQRHVDHDELMNFVYILNRQAYTRKLRELAPAFRRRVSGNSQYLKEFDELMSFLEMRV